MAYTPRSVANSRIAMAITSTTRAIAALIMGILGFPIPCSTPLEILEFPLRMMVMTPSIIS